MKMISRATILSRRMAVSMRPIGARLYTEGATGSPRPEQGRDAFNKREKAQEDLYVRRLETEKLAKLRESLKKQREHLDEVEAQLDDLTSKH